MSFYVPFQQLEVGA